jgi:hypothetical protein
MACRKSSTAKENNPYFFFPCFHKSQAAIPISISARMMIANKAHTFDPTLSVTPVALGVALILPATGPVVALPVPPAGTGEIVTTTTGTGVIVTTGGVAVTPEIGPGEGVTEGAGTGVAVGTGVIAGYGVIVGIGVIVGTGVTDGTGVAVGRPQNHGNEGTGNGGDGTDGTDGRSVTTWASACVLMMVLMHALTSTFNAGRIKSVELTKQIIAKRLMIALYIWHP